MGGDVIKTVGNGQKDGQAIFARLQPFFFSEMESKQ